MDIFSDNIKGTSTNSRLRLLGVVFLVCVVCITSLAMRGIVTGNYGHPDEIIPVRVVEKMMQNHSFDTNWADARLPPAFKYEQYNFSSYHVLLRVISGLGISPEEPGSERKQLIVFRTVSVTFFIFSLLLCFRIARQEFGTSVALVSAVLYCVSHQLYQDSLYARPEAFYTAMFLACIAGSQSIRITKPHMMLLCGALFGLMLACKISTLILTPFLLMLFSRNLAERWQGGFDAKYFCLIAFGAAAGFVIGVPYVLTNPIGWWRGVQALFSQYASGTLPHGLPDGNLIDHISFSWQFIVDSLGVWIICFAAVGAARCFVEKRYGWNWLVWLPMGTFLYFSSKPVFFERNFSHVLPLVFILAAYGVLYASKRLFETMSTQAIFVLMVLPILLYKPTSLSKRIFDEIIYERNIRKASVVVSRMEERYGCRPKLYPGGIMTDSRRELLYKLSAEDSCPIIVFKGYGDRYSKQQLEKVLISGRFAIVHYHYGPFSDFATSTLQPYFGGDLIFLLKLSEIGSGLAETATN